MAIRAADCTAEHSIEKFEMRDAFNLANRLQAYRQVKAFEVTYLRMDGKAG